MQGPPWPAAFAEAGCRDAQHTMCHAFGTTLELAGALTPGAAETSGADLAWFFPWRRPPHTFRSPAPGHGRYGPGWRPQQQLRRRRRPSLRTRGGRSGMGACGQPGPLRSDPQCRSNQHLPPLPPPRHLPLTAPPPPAHGRLARACSGGTADAHMGPAAVSTAAASAESLAAQEEILGDVSRLRPAIDTQLGDLKSSPKVLRAEKRAGGRKRRNAEKRGARSYLPRTCLRSWPCGVSKTRRLPSPQQRERRGLKAAAGDGDR